MATNIIKAVNNEARMRVLTSREIDDVQGGFCPICLGMWVTFAFGAGGAGAACALWSSQQLLLMGSLSTAITVAVTSGIWYSNKQYITMSS